MSDPLDPDEIDRILGGEFVVEDSNALLHLMAEEAFRRSQEMAETCPRCAETSLVKIGLTGGDAEICVRCWYMKRPPDLPLDQVIDG